MWIIIIFSPILDPEAVISSAGLHYLASVGKRPTDLQDASTNTDPGKKSDRNFYFAVFMPLKLL